MCSYIIGLDCYRRTLLGLLQQQGRAWKNVSSIRSSTDPGKLKRALVMMVLDAKVDLDTHVGNAGVVGRAIPSGDLSWWSWFCKEEKRKTESRAIEKADRKKDGAGGRRAPP